VTSQSFTSCLDIASGIGGTHHLITPASLSMAAKIAGRLRITLIEKATHKPGSTTAMSYPTLEDMSLASLNVLNGRKGLEKHVDRCIPVLAETS
jgi:hypothetical protein